jgi:uroporphyrinogen decarboxylase
MNTRERFHAIMNFEKPDRNLIWEMGYWLGTVNRWYEEGLPKTHGLTIAGDPGMGVRGEAIPHDPLSVSRERDRDVHEAMGMDSPIVTLPLNLGPQPLFEPVVFEETEDFLITQDEFGVKKRLNKTGASIPQFIDWQIGNRADFERIIEERFQPDFENRIPAQWDSLVETYRNRDYPLCIGGYPYGFYGFLRYLMGEERLLYNFYDDPTLVHDIMNFLADFWIALYEQALSQVTVDCVHFWEDMAYKAGPLISPAMFREFMMPAYRKVTDFLKARGISAILVDSDGNVDLLIPLFLEAGLTGMYPFEVQAGNDIVAIRKQYPKLQITGGLDKIKIGGGKAAIDQELESKVPFMLSQGGYIPHFDHLVDPGVSWEDFRYYRKRLNEMIAADADKR